MSLNWQDSTSPARIKAYTAAMASGEFDSKVPTWDIYCDLRYALTWALLITGFPPKSDWGITEKNWKAVYCRLQILEAATGCKRIYNNGDKPSRKVYFTPEEIRSMIGFGVNAGTKTDAEFKKYIFRQLTDDAEAKLDHCINPSKSRAEDPYYWERLFTPKHLKEKAA